MSTSYHSSRSSTAEPPAACPVRSDWSPLAADYLTDPYPMAAVLRAETPIFFDRLLGHLVVTRRADIDDVLLDHQTYSSANVQDPVAELCPEARTALESLDPAPVAVMSNRAEPDHGRIRVHTSRAFSNRRIAGLEPFIRDRCASLLDDMLSRPGPSDLVEELAFPLPGETVFRLIGFPPEDDDLLKSWCGDRKVFAWGDPPPHEQVEMAGHMREYWEYCRAYTATCWNEPGDDLTSELLAVHRDDPEELAYREVESIVYGLSFAGHEAVTALITNAVLALVRHRDQWDTLCEGPATVANAVDEVLRYESSQISWRRVTTRATVLGGIELPAGMPILLNFAAANREPGQFEDPERFDVRRPDARHHISFGKGIHYCLGARLARVETRIVLEELVGRVPSLRLVEPQDLEYSRNITFRGPRALWVDWDRS